MRNTTKKILLALVLTLAMVAVLAVCAFAFDINTDLPQGVTNTDAKWVASGYSDVDTEDGWYYIGGPADYSATEDSFPTFAFLAGSRFYWNKTTNEAVWLVTASNLSANFGEHNVVSLKDVTADTKKKFYAYASCFVDVANTANNAFKIHFASNTTEKAQYVTQSAAKYPIYERYIQAKVASPQWSNVNVTKAAYDGFVAYKAELGYAEDESVTDTAHQDLLVEWAYVNIATYKNLVNCKENGAKFNMAWIFNQLEKNGLPFESVEFRAAPGVAPMISTAGLVIQLMEAKTILVDSKIVKLAIQNTWRGLIYNVNSLKTFAHVAFNDDGTYEGTVEEGTVDMTGFTQTVTYKVSGVTSYATQLMPAIGPDKIVWFSTIVEGDEDYAGIIDTQAMQSSKAKEVVIPASVTLKEIRGAAFSSCTNLNTIDVKGTVSPGLVIAKTAFDGVKNLTIKVYSELDKANMEKALAAASITGVTVEATKTEEPDVGGETVAIPSVITADGFMLRTKSYNGLRALFTFNDAKAEAVAAETGYTLVEYGALAASAKSLEAAGSAEKLFANADGKKIQRIVIFADDDTGLNKYVDIDAKQYCIAVKDFSGANTLKDIYVAGYAMWSNGTDTVITFADYTTKTGKNTISLYTLTLEMYKAGVINAQNTDEICLWDVLQNGALAVTETETKAPSEFLTLTQGYEYDAEGKFTYLDLPLRAWNMYKNAAGNLVWNSVGVTVEETSTTGVLWSILVDGDSLVVVYRADPEAETSALPKLSDSYAASAPYSSNYFAPRDNSEKNVTEDSTANGLLKTATIYSPIVSDANAKKINTVVVDYGVDKFGESAFDDSKRSNNIGTIVYPEGVTAGHYVLAGCTSLKNFTYATADKTYLEGYDVTTLADLSGISGISFVGITQNAAAVENLLLPTSDKMTSGDQYGFGGAKALRRVWTVGADMPAEGVMDLTQTKIKSICKGFFNNLDNIDDVYMPETFTTVSAYSMATKNQKTDTARWNLFGNNSKETKLNIHVTNWTALDMIANKFYEARQNIEYNDGKEGDPSGIAHIVDYLQITYEGETKTVLEWRENFPAQPAA